MNNSVPFIMGFLSLMSLVAISVTSLLLLKISMHANSNLLLLTFSEIATKETLYFVAVVVMITTVISIYSFFYLGTAYKTVNFLWTLSFFAFSMLCLIIADSLTMYILGWDGLGASSFLLILFYNTLFSYRSGLATFLTNRLGDVFIILSFVLMANKENIIANTQMFPHYSRYLEFSFLLLMLGAATKSAQMPFSAWLPAAMAAPTPVSALVHSSTLVTAGIYLLYRYTSLSDILSKNMTGIFSLMGILLSLLAGLMAFYETDLKKLIAMSTLSQLGILIYILFQKQPEITLIHVMSHAFFKSLLFLVVGFLIFTGMGVQDARTKSFIKTSSQVSMVLIFITSVSLMGFAFTPGFFSKDLILSSYPEQGLNVIIYSLLLLSCILTVMYSTKSFIILMNNMHLKQNTSNTSMDNKFLMPSILLVTMMVLFGYFFFFFILESEMYIQEVFNKIAGVTIIITGSLFTLLFLKSKKQKSLTKTSKNLVEKFTQMVNMNWISNNFVSSKTMKMSHPLKMENSWMEMVVEMKTKKFVESNETTLSKRSKSMTNLEMMLFLMVSMIILLMLSLFL